MWNELRYGLAAALMALSLLVLCTGVLGVFRFRDTLQRMHAAGVNDTLGLFLAAASLILAEGWSAVSLKLALALLFLWIASPLSTHLIARLEFHARETGKADSAPPRGKTASQSAQAKAKTRRRKEAKR